jgi:hypothetical protein
VPGRCLIGPATATFDLRLRRWTGSGWVVVAAGSGPHVDLHYTGAAGYYAWTISSASGGPYEFLIDLP